MNLLKINYLFFFFLCLNSAAAQTETKIVKLDVERLEERKNCIRGKLYFNNKFLCYTFERPFLNNNNGTSSIPEGQYEGWLRHTDLKGEKGRKYDAWRVQLEDTPGRKHIQLHSGSSPIQSTKGCILLSTTNNESGGGCQISYQNESVPAYNLLAQKLLEYTGELNNNTGKTEHEVLIRLAVYSGGANTTQEAKFWIDPVKICHYKSGDICKSHKGNLSYWEASAASINAWVGFNSQRVRINEVGDIIEKKGFWKTFESSDQHPPMQSPVDDFFNYWFLNYERVNKPTWEKIQQLLLHKGPLLITCPSSKPEHAFVINELTGDMAEKTGRKPRLGIIDAAKNKYRTSIDKSKRYKYNITWNRFKRLYGDKEIIVAYLK